MKAKRRIVVKVGSNVLTRADGKANVTNMSALVDQIAALRHKGHEVILVSSGAVACGRGVVKSSRKLDEASQRQVFSSVGQIKLINTYSSLFGDYGIIIGQVLTQKDNFASRNAYLNQRSCMDAMLRCGVLPIVNENDTASMTELMFTDNDELSGTIAAMMDADTLIILSNIDGIYTGAPDDPESQLIARVKPGEDLSRYIRSSRSGLGRGGMVTKYGIARMLSEEGVRVVIANGTRPGILADLIERPGETPHTEFEPSTEAVSSVKRWIAHSGSFAKGSLHVNARAAEALRGPEAVSLLPIGLTHIAGEWTEGDIVKLFDPDGELIGIGRADMDSATTESLIGKHGARPVVHYDYLIRE
ncbi:MAG: glutamate 5-kinase [Candidatus Amulumruptor caecigallinarius]|nr:glutamate 5-kinase [Candidatus Amulumruptor caecigallinarius]MCM1397761.1 glutamate 5-kinase [Candidatus Amulumruptor caecigallinarius]MCM1454501.1 glutamate 5-kinase [bacterium]